MSPRMEPLLLSAAFCAAACERSPGAAARPATSCARFPAELPWAASAPTKLTRLVFCLAPPPGSLGRIVPPISLARRARARAAASAFFCCRASSSIASPVDDELMATRDRARA